MEIKILSQKQNTLLKRQEVDFLVEHGQPGSTPVRSQVRKAIAVTLKIDETLVFLKRFETKAGMRDAAGIAHVYDSLDHAKQIEPEYIIKRNIPPEKPKEEAKE